MNRTLRLAAALGFLWGLLPVVFGAHWAGLDLFRMDLGAMCEIKNLLKSGDSLGIAPHIGLGVPFAADPLQGVLYPLRWLVLWLPNSLSTDAQITLHYGIAAAGAALLGRSFGLTRLHSLLLGLAYLGSGTLQDLARHSIYLVGGAWLPWSWAFARLLAQRPTALRAAGLSLSLGLMLLAGDAFTWTWGFSLALFEAFLRYERTRKGKLLAWTVFAAGLGGAIGLAVWLPAWRELSSGVRQQGIYYRSSLDWSWSLREFPGVILAGAFKPEAIPGGSLWNFVGIRGENAPWNFSPYIGLLSFWGAVTALFGVWLPFRSRSRHPRMARLRPLTLLWGFALIFALGRHTPIVPFLFRTLPFLTNLRYPAKHWVALNLISLLLAFTFLQLQIKEGSRRLGLVWSLSLASIGGILALLAWHRARALELSKMLADALELPWTSKSPTLVDLILQGLAPGVLAVALLGTLLLAATRKPRLRGWLLAPLTLEIALAAPHHVNWFSRDQSLTQVFSPLKVIEEEYRTATGNSPVFCAGKSIAFGSLPLKSQDQSKNFVGMAFYQRLVALPQVNACDQVHIAETYSVLANRSQIMLEPMIHEQVTASRALGCTHVLGIAPKDKSRSEKMKPLLEGVLSSASEEIVVLEIEDPIPLAFATNRAKPLRSLAAIESLASQKLSSRQILEYVEGLPDDLVNRLNSVESKTDPKNLLVRAEHPNTTHWRVTFDSSSPLKSPLMVGVRNSQFAGWHAYQGGQEIPKVTLGGGLLAAWVENPARGPVDFKYELFHRAGRTFEMPPLPPNSSSSNATSPTKPSVSRSTATR